MTDVRRRDGDGTGGLRDGSATFEELREQAVALRREGLSRRQIRDRLKVHNNNLLNRLLDGEPPLEWTKRPNAKDDLRAAAREMRARGMTYDEIQLELGCPKSSISLWVRDLPKPERPPRTPVEASAAAKKSREAALHQRNFERWQTKLSAANEIGNLSRRELFLVGVGLYWAEGAKDKPYDRREKIVFVNSDPDMVSTFLAWLDLLGVTPGRRRYTVNIHESADVGRAEHFWLERTGATPDQFGKTALKKHSPKTTRRNTGADYHGCLAIRVNDSADLYRRVEGWWYGIVVAAGRTA
ncbi:hypothetical protein KBZ10_22605 [Streptomyces sp. F63]|uniref:hypothetical protein n=1 Tax=Streptomyces sp. F63 TaxID=2824887 RepID=UPI001B35BF5E|nr:hypothetical protein [Streptomyces sp. F63]MBQ0987259.1 hypothetical protein [Streptomyces sp. F63]